MRLIGVVILTICLEQVVQGQTAPSWTSNTHLQTARCQFLSPGQSNPDNSILLSPNKPDQNVIVPYSDALTQNPTIKPAISFFDLDFSVQNNNLFFSMQVNDLKNVHFQLNIRVLSLSNFIRVRIWYLAVESNYDERFKIMEHIDTPVVTGPTQYSSFHSFQSTGLILDVNKMNIILGFVNKMDLSSPTNDYHLHLDLRIQNQSHYQVKVTTDYIMTIAQIRLSLIIFDKTTIQFNGFSFFEYGLQQAFNNMNSGVSLTLNPQIGNNFIMGLNSFKLANVQRLYFDNSFQATIILANTASYLQYKFQYWHMKTALCTSSQLYFKVATRTCFKDCGTGYSNNNIQTNLCSPICGDGLFIPSGEWCDNANNQNMDGCSYSCQIQHGFVCKPNSSPGPSDCTYTLSINITVISVSKVEGANQAQIEVTLSPRLKIFQGYNFTRMISTDMPVSSYQVIYSPETGIGKIILIYTESIQGRNCTITVNPPDEGVFRLTQTSTSYVTMRSEDKSLLNYYQPEYYTIAGIIKILAIAISVLSWILVFSSIYLGKLIALEGMAVVQLSSIGLLAIPSTFNPCLISLTYLSFSTGLNIFPFISTLPHLIHELPATFIPLTHYPTFLQNYNLDVILLILPASSALIAYIIRRTKYQSQNTFLTNLISKLIREILFAALLISAYAIFVFTGIQFAYSVGDMSGAIDYMSLVFCLGMVLLYAFYFVFFYRSIDKFGEFISFFTSCDLLSKRFYSYIMIERIAVAFSLAFIGSGFGLILPAVCCAFQIVVIASKKLYVRSIDNYRSITNMIISLGVLGIYSYFAFIGEQSIQANPFSLYLPIVVVILLLISILYNAVFLILFIRKTIKEEHDDRKNLIEINKLNKMWIEAPNAHEFTHHPLFLIKQEIEQASSLQKLLKAKFIKDTALELRQGNQICNRQKQLFQLQWQDFLNLQSLQSATRTKQNNDFQKEGQIVPKQQHSNILNQNNQIVVNTHPDCDSI